MITNECVAMVLAGGRGERLGSLTRFYSKPAVYFGSGNRIIDFTLRNCERSGISTVGILSQYFATDLQIYAATTYGGKNVTMLPSKSDAALYLGTADAIYKNIDFLDRLNPDAVLVLAGDHVYNMDYRNMIAFHKSRKADVTVASARVPMRDAPRYGILSVDRSFRVYGFDEKPQIPQSDLASMGIYVFDWNMLKDYLIADHADPNSKHDFGLDILPRILYAGQSVYTYPFDGYWRDVGTVDSFWRANMEQIEDPLPDDDCLSDKRMPLSHISGSGTVKNCILGDGCAIFGKAEHSVLGRSVTICEGAEVVDSVIMPNVYIGANVKIRNAVIGTRAAIMDGAMIGIAEGTDFFIDGNICSYGVSLVAPWLHVGGGLSVQGNSHICAERLYEWEANNVWDPGKIRSSTIRVPVRGKRIAALSVRH